MKNRFDQSNDDDLNRLRLRVAGLGEDSGRKTYYPELRRRLSELERFRALIDRIHDLVFVLDLETGMIEDANHAACETLGYGKADLLANNIRDIIRDLPDITEGLGKSEHTPITTKMTTKDGRTIPIELSSSSIGTPSGHLKMVVARDITERQLFNEQLIRTSERAEAANRTKSEFLANMSHEIRTPLNSVLGFTEMLTNTSLSEEQQQYVRMISRAGSNLLNLINDILDLSKIESGKLKLDIRHLILKDVIEETFEILSKNAKSKGLDTFCEIDPHIPEWLLGDAHRLKQIITNLVSNAIKFTQHGEIGLRATLEKQCSSCAEVLIEVIDTGVGIPAERMPDLFGRFTQLDSSTTRKFGGTGLGLNISRELVEMMGGRIWAESVPGKGSTFKFRIPFAIPEAKATVPEENKVEIPCKAGKTATRTVERKEMPPLKILVAEDSFENQTLIRAFLKGLPFHLHFAENGHLAFEAFKLEHFDLVLMDMEMPVMDGYSATRLIREWEIKVGRTPTPILAQTAHALSEKITESRKAGCNSHLSKPLSKSALIDAIINSSERVKPASRRSKQEAQTLA